MGDMEATEENVLGGTHQRCGTLSRTPHWQGWGGGPSHSIESLYPSATSTFWRSQDVMAALVKIPLVNILRQDDSSHCMMGTIFGEELPGSNMENGNDNRKNTLSLPHYVIPRDKNLYFQTPIKPMIRMVRQMEMAACGMSHATWAP